jgi:glycosyltransferase involved in cell wall biosynthesis
MFHKEAKGGPALRTMMTLRALSKVFDVSLLVWTDEQLGFEDEIDFLQNFSFCKNVFVKSKKIVVGTTFRANNGESKFKRKIKTFLIILEAKLFLGDAIRALRQNKEKAEYVEKVVIEHGFGYVWWSFANLESKSVLLFAKGVSQHSIAIVADTDSVWSRFILRSLPFVPIHTKLSVARTGLGKRRDEKKLIRKVNVLTAVSETDRSFYSKISKSENKIMIVRNAIQVEEYQNDSKIWQNSKRKCQNGVLLMGSFGRKYSPMDYGALWFITNVWPIVRKSINNAELHIVGKGSKEFLRTDEDFGIFVHGAVDSINPYARFCKVSIVPLFFESGTRFKILEAAALGLVTVTTSLGNEGLEFKDKVDLYVANDPENFAYSVLLAMQESHDSNLIRNARIKLIHNYSFENLVNDINQVAERLN